jgi:SnoaL-like domain
MQRADDRVRYMTRAALLIDDLTQSGEVYGTGVGRPLGRRRAVYTRRHPRATIAAAYTAKSPLNPPEGGNTMDLQQTADWIEIFQLKSKYSWYYDTPDLEKLLSLFTEDAVLDMGPYGKHEGLGQVRELFIENISSPGNGFPTLHATTNPLIEINGDEATGQFTFSTLC